MIKVSILGLAAVLVFVAFPCQAGINVNTPDVTFWPADKPTTDMTGLPTLTDQILGAKAQVVSFHSDPNYPEPDPDPADYLVDSHTSALYKREAGSGPLGTGIMSLDQFDPTRIVPGGTDPVGQLRGVLLYVSVRLRSGRLVLDNESANVIQTATLKIGATLRLFNDAIQLDFSTTRYATKTNTQPILKDIGTVPFDGQYPNPRLSEAELEKYCVGDDKLAAIISPNGPTSFDDAAPIYTDVTTDPNILALFIGNGTIDLSFTSKPFAEGSYDPGYTAIVWPSVVTFDIEMRVVYLYANAIPEPASMSLLGAALVPVLLRRFRGRKSRR
jgi:hypothetical protein